MEDEEEVRIDVGDVHGRDDDYHQTSLALESSREHRLRVPCAGPPLFLLLVAACAHAPGAPSPTREVLATPAGVAEARASWVASSVRLARTEVMRGRFGQARTLLEPALDRAAAEGDAPGKARLEAELALVLAEESFYGRTGAERGVAARRGAGLRAHPATPGRRGERAARGGYLRYGEALWAEAKDFQAPRERFARARDLFREARDASGVAQETFFLGLTEEQEGKRSAPSRSMPRRSGAPRRPAIGRRRRTRSATSRACPSRGVTSTKRSRCIVGASRCREEIGLIRGVPYALIAIGDLERKKGALSDARGQLHAGACARGGGGQRTGELLVARRPRRRRRGGGKVRHGARELPAGAADREDAGKQELGRGDRRRRREGPSSTVRSPFVSRRPGDAHRWNGLAAGGRRAGGPLCNAGEGGAREELDRFSEAIRFARVTPGGVGGALATVTPAGDVPTA